MTLKIMIKISYSYQVFVQNDENNPFGGYVDIVTTHHKFTFYVKVPIKTNDRLYFLYHFFKEKLYHIRISVGHPIKLNHCIFKEKSKLERRCYYAEINH